MQFTHFRELHFVTPLNSTCNNRTLVISYDQEADTLYVNFKKPTVATDSEITDDDVIVRYEGDSIIGLTVLHASQRAG